MNAPKPAAEIRIGGFCGMAEQDLRRWKFRGVRVTGLRLVILKRDLDAAIAKWRTKIVRARGSSPRRGLWHSTRS